MLGEEGLVLEFGQYDEPLPLAGEVACGLRALRAPCGNLRAVVPRGVAALQRACCHEGLGGGLAVAAVGLLQEAAAVGTLPPGAVLVAPQLYAQLLAQRRDDGLPQARTGRNGVGTDGPESQTG